MDQRITQLTSLPKAGVDATDVLPIADVSASQTKKVTAKDLVDAGLDLIDVSSIDLDKLDQASTTKLGTTALADDAVTAAKLAHDSSIAVQTTAPSTDNFEGRGYFDSASAALQVFDGSAYQQVVAPTAGIGDLQVTTDKLADGAVTTTKVTALDTAAYADSSVTTAKIADGAVTGAKIANDTITATQVAPNAIGVSELASDAVETAAIVDLAVTAAKLSDGAVTTNKLGDLAITDDKIAATTISYGKLNLADGSIPGAKIATDSIAAGQIAANAVGTSELANTSVTTDKVADLAITGAKIANDSVTAVQIAPSAVGASELADNAVDTAAVVDLAVTAAKLADGAVTTAKLGGLAVTDAKIAAATISYGKLNLADGSVPGAKIATDSITTGQIAASAVSTSELVDAAVTTAKIADGAVTAAKIATDSITSTQIAPSAVGASELADNAVDTAAIVDASVTEAKLAGGAVTTNKLGDLAVTDAKIAATTITYGKLNLADGAVPASKLTDATVTGAKLAANAVGTAAVADAAVTTAKVADSAITTAKVAAGAITTAKVDAAGLAAAAIATDAITTAKVLDGAITGAKMADDSATIVQAGTPTGSGDFEGQQWFDTNTSVQYVWNSTTWIRQAALNVINFTDTTPIAFAIAYPDNHTANITTTLDTQVANTAFLGPTTGANAAPTFRDIVPDDLPDATASTKGIIQPGTGLAVNGGTLNHTNSVTAGTYTKVTVDAQGHVSAAPGLEASDIPSLNASKITEGEFPTARLANDAVTIDKLADYSTASLGETFPTPASFIGQLHLNPLDKSFYMWDGNVWVPIGISAGQIIFAGTFDASTPSGVGKISFITPEGAAAGFTVNGALPASSPANNRHYLVVSEGGTITSGNAPNVQLAPPDLILSVYNTTSPSWVEVDVSAGAGAIAASQVSFTPSGDLGATTVQVAIEEVSADSRIATNITSGTLAVARGGTNLASYTKGDIIAASAATTLAKRTVGTNGQVLTANSADATGLAWTTPTTGTVTTVSSSTAALTVATATTTPALTVRSATTSVNGIVQLSNSTSTTSSTLAATPTAVKAAYDLADAALPKAGGVITGVLEIGNTGSLVFEGSTNDGNETTITVADPTADRTITFPNVTGNVVTTGDSGTVTSTMIANSTIVDADISASAAIADTKLGTISTAGKVLDSALPDTISSSITGNAATATNLSSNRTFALTGDVTGSVSSNLSSGASIAATIADGIIDNANISPTAAIADTKLATISTAGKVLDSALPGTISSNITGNAATATTLATARTLTIGSTGKTFNGSANVSWTAAEILLSPVSGNWFRGYLGSDSNGVTELGRYLDFHATNTSVNDYDARLECTGVGAFNFTGATVTAGTFVGALTGTASGNLVSGGALGTPASGNLANCTFPTLNQSTTGNAATATNLSSNRTFALTGDVTGSVSSNLSSGASIAATIAVGIIDNANISATAAIADTKLATISTAGKVSDSALPSTISSNITGNAATVTTNANLTGDVTSVGNATAIAAGVIVNADINASAGIVDTKLATITTPGKIADSALPDTISSNITGNSATTSGCTFSSDSSIKDDITTRTDSGFYESPTGTLAEGWPTNSGGYHHLISCTHTNDANYYALQLSSQFGTQNLYFRNTNDSGAQAWSAILHSNNFSSYAPALNGALGTPSSGNLANCTFPTLNQSTTGNAATATNLSSNRTFALTGDVTGSVSSNLSSGASIAATIAAGIIDNANISPTAAIADTKLATISTAGKVLASALPATISSSTTGNAATATTLQTARTIGGVSFNGSANINLPGVNTAGNQNTSGNAATATTLATARTINGVSFNGSANINVPDLRASNGTVLVDGTGVTSAVNYVSLTNAATAGTVTLSTAGSDANIPLQLTTKGTGSLTISTSGGNIGLRPTAGSILFYDATNTYYTNLDNGSLTANRTLTMPNGNVTLVSGTMVPTTGTGATGSWGISVTGSSASCTGNSATATTATNCSRSVLAGNGITGGGALSGNVTLTLGTPGSLTGSTTNAVTTTSHTHEVTVNLGATGGTTAGPVITSSAGTSATIPSASPSASGIVTTNSQTFAGTKTFQDGVRGGSVRNTANLDIEAGTSGEGALYLEASATAAGRVRSLTIFNNTTASTGNEVRVIDTGTLQRISSSIKYKKDVELLEDQYADAIIDNAKPTWYRSKCEADNPDWGHYGFIAEELVQIDPRLVCLTPDEDGSYLHSDGERYEPEGVQYQSFVPLLVNVIQRQRKTIKDMQTSLAALEARITALEA